MADAFRMSPGPNKTAGCTTAQIQNSTTTALACDWGPIRVLVDEVVPVSMESNLFLAHQTFVLTNR